MAEITYQFDCEDGSTHHYTVSLTEDVTPEPDAGSLPEWTNLDFHQCQGCRWDKSDKCPVAIGLQEPVRLMDKLNSFEKVHVTVTTPNRSYSKDSTIQEGLSGLFGLVMARSGCPAFELFRGLAWFHLPFSTYEETMFRVAGGHLLKQYMFDEEVKNKTDIVADIQAIYEDINAVNRGIVKRLKEGVAPQCDSPLNAIVLLDSMGSMVSISVENGLKEVKEKFV